MKNAKEPATSLVVRCGKSGKIQQVSIRPDQFTIRKRAVFLDQLAATGNVHFSAGAAGVHHATAYRLRRRDAEFGRLWQHALEAGYDRLQEMLIQRASGIIDLPIGETPVPSILNMDTELAMRLLENNRRSVILGIKRNDGKPTRATEEQTDAAIIKKLRALAKRSGHVTP